MDCPGEMLIGPARTRRGWSLSGEGGWVGPWVEVEEGQESGQGIVGAGLGRGGFGEGMNLLKGKEVGSPVLGGESRGAWY